MSFGHITVVREWKEEQPCKWCRRPFLTDVIEFHGGKRMRANVCDHCAEISKQRERPEVTNLKRKQEWDSMAGGYYSIFDPDRLPPAMQPHWENALRWEVSPRGIGFLGRSRTAKSKVIHELGRRLYIAGLDVFPTSGVEFSEKVSNQVKDREDWEWYFSRCKNCKVLVLDDADKVKFTEAVESNYYSMLETRRRFERPVLVTVNSNGAEMARSITENRGEPIINRLRDLCQITELKAPR